MKKAFKVIGKAGKIYIVSDLMLLAVIGAGVMLEHLDWRNPDLFDTWGNVVEDTKLRYKKYWNS